MSAPRKTCPECDRSVPVRKDGALRNHYPASGGRMWCNGGDRTLPEPPCPPRTGNNAGEAPVNRADLSPAAQVIQEAIKAYTDYLFGLTDPHLASRSLPGEIAAALRNRGMLSEYILGEGPCGHLMTAISLMTCPECCAPLTVEEMCGECGAPEFVRCLECHPRP